MKTFACLLFISAIALGGCESDAAQRAGDGRGLGQARAGSHSYRKHDDKPARHVAANQGKGHAYRHAASAKPKDKAAPAGRKGDPRALAHVPPGHAKHAPALHNDEGKNKKGPQGATARGVHPRDAKGRDAAKDARSEIERTEQKARDKAAELRREAGEKQREAAEKLREADDKQRLADVLQRERQNAPHTTAPATRKAE